jgi:hypothetical protein
MNLLDKIDLVKAIIITCLVVLIALVIANPSTLETIFHRSNHQ